MLPTSSQKLNPLEQKKAKNKKTQTLFVCGLCLQLKRTGKGKEQWLRRGVRIFSLFQMLPSWKVCMWGSRISKPVTWCLWTLFMANYLAAAHLFPVDTTHPHSPSFIHSLSLIPLWVIYRYIYINIKSVLSSIDVSVLTLKLSLVILKIPHGIKLD